MPERLPDCRDCERIALTIISLSGTTWKRNSRLSEDFPDSLAVYGVSQDLEEREHRIIGFQRWRVHLVNKADSCSSGCNFQPPLPQDDLYRHRLQSSTTDTGRSPGSPLFYSRINADPYHPHRSQARDVLKVLMENGHNTIRWWKTRPTLSTKYGLNHIRWPKNGPQHWRRSHRSIRPGWTVNKQ